MGSDAETVFDGMFSLLRSTGDVKHLLCRDLPALHSSEEVNKTAETVESEAAMIDQVFPLLLKITNNKVTRCPHYQRKHYAKNMCSNCYHKLGRQHTAWACRHKERPMYAKGRCQYCYLRMYSRKKLKAIQRGRQGVKP